MILINKTRIVHANSKDRSILEEIIYLLANFNASIRYASAYDRLEVVKELLKDERVNPDIKAYPNMYLEIENNYESILKEILKK